MRHNVTLLFDVEDLCWPGSDDIVLDLTRIMARKQIRGTFYVVGEKARLWERRGRTDLVATLAPHDVGLHTDLHSIHPTTSEYLAPCGWLDGIREAVRREVPGFESIQRIFGREASSWGQAGGTWGPQIHAALAEMDVPCAVYPYTHSTSSDVHWYAGSLTFSGDNLQFFDSDLVDEERFEGRLTAMGELLDSRIASGQTWTGIFVCHPTRLRAVEFWDGLNFAKGHNTDPANYTMPHFHPEGSYDVALRNFETVLDTLAGDSRMAVQTIAELRDVYLPPAREVSPLELQDAARELVGAANGDIPTDNPRLSPAETVYLLAESLLAGETRELTRRDVYGPIEEPSAQMKTSLEADELEAMCKALIEYVEAHGHLPASLGTSNSSIGIGTFGRIAAAALLERDMGRSIAGTVTANGLQVPAIADAIVERVNDGFVHWPVHDPDMDTTRLLLHTRLQSWTIRPAIGKVT